VLSDFPFGSLPQKVPDAVLAQVLLNSHIGSEDRVDTKPVPCDLSFTNCNGDPELEKPSRASLWFDYEGIPALTDPRVDGAYMDTLGWGSFDMGENYRRDHWATADIPLVPSFREGKPCQFAIFAHYELYEAVADAMRERGKLTLANTFPFAQTFTAHLLDVMGAGESNNLEHFHQAPRLSYCRGLAFRKPVSHMNYGYLLPDVPLAEKERAMQRNLVFCIWPGTGNGGNLAHLEAVRGLYRKYVPIFHALSRAGWEPLTFARVTPDPVVLERYGRPGGALYLAAHNPTYEPIAAQIALGPELRAAPLPPGVTDLVTGELCAVKDGRLRLSLGPFQTAVLTLGR
jgi:hypothetical protein